jgi:ligand-binding sensor domain-containing protein
LYILRDRKPAQLVSPGRVSALLAEGKTVLAAINKRLVTIDTNLKVVNEEPAVGNRTVLSMLRSQDRSVWVGTSEDVGRLEPGAKAFQWLDRTQSGGLAHGEAGGLAEDANGEIWVGFDGAGALRISANGFLTYGETDGLPPGQVRSLSLDRKGRLIVAMHGNPGLSAYRFEKGRFAEVDLGVSNHLYEGPWFPWHETLIESREGNWWSASEHGLIRLAAPDDHEKTRPLSIFTKSDGMPADDVAHVFEDSNEGRSGSACIAQELRATVMGDSRFLRLWRAYPPAAFAASTRTNITIYGWDRVGAELPGSTT